MLLTGCSYFLSFFLFNPFTCVFMLQQKHHLLSHTIAPIFTFTGNNRPELHQVVPTKLSVGSIWRTLLSHTHVFSIPKMNTIKLWLSPTLGSTLESYFLENHEIATSFPKVHRVICINFLRHDLIFRTKSIIRNINLNS